MKGLYNFNIKDNNGSIVMTKHYDTYMNGWSLDEDIYFAKLPITYDQQITLGAFTTPDNGSQGDHEHEAYSSIAILRKEKPMPEISGVTLVTNNNIGDNTKISYRVDTKKYGDVGVTIEAKLGGVVKTKSVAAGRSVTLDWDSMEVGEGTHTSIEVSIKVAGYTTVKKNYATNLNIRYLLKEITDKLLGQLSPKSNVQRTVILNISNRHIENNLTNIGKVDP